MLSREENRRMGKKVKESYGDALKYSDIPYKKLYRKMSLEEYEKYINGENLIACNEPNRDSSANEPTFYFADNMYDLEKFGINSDIICEFIVDEKIFNLFKKGYGKVRNEPFFGSGYTEKVIEHHISEYNNELLKLTNCAYIPLDKSLERIDPYEIESIEEMIFGKAYVIFKNMQCEPECKDKNFMECEELLLSIGIDINSITESDYYKIVNQYPNIYKQIQEKGIDEQLCGYNGLIAMTDREKEQITKRYLNYGIDLDNIKEEELLNILNTIDILYNLDGMTPQTLKILCAQGYCEMDYNYCLQHISTLDYIGKFNHHDLYNEMELASRKIEDELEEEADYYYYGDNEYDDGEYDYEEYYDDYNEDYYTPDEIAKGIDTREGEIEEVLNETDELARQNDREETFEQDGQTQADE